MYKWMDGWLDGRKEESEERIKEGKMVGCMDG